MFKFKPLYKARAWLAKPIISAIPAIPPQADLGPLVSTVSTQIDLQRSQHDLLMRAEWAMAMSAAKNPLNRFGAKYFSQTDEDGITLEILRRMDIRSGIFAEIGVGSGLENNTLILLASGWRGFWIGDEDLRFDHRLNPKRLAFIKARVTSENVVGLMQRGFENMATNELDVLGLDLDINDYYVARALLKAGILPKLFVLEYNSKFPPPIKWAIKYDAEHTWDGTDYHGASLALFAELLTEMSYSLVCCNGATGANAFFVRNEYLPRFADVPKNIDDIFVGCRYQLYQRWGHPPSSKTIERMLLSMA